MKSRKLLFCLKRSNAPRKYGGNPRALQIFLFLLFLRKVSVLLLFRSFQSLGFAMKQANSFCSLFLKKPCFFFFGSRFLCSFCYKSSTSARRSQELFLIFLSCFCLEGIFLISIEKKKHCHFSAKEEGIKDFCL